MFRIIFLCVPLIMAGCSGWYGAAPDKPLPGKRISILSLEDSLKPDPKLSKVEIILPPPFKNLSWHQAGGKPNHVMGHISASGELRTLWKVSIGKGSSSDAQLITAPVVYRGLIFTMDV